MIKIEDLNYDEIVDLYMYIRNGKKKKVIGENQYQAVTKWLEEEISRRHKESPLW